MRQVRCGFIFFFICLSAASVHADEEVAKLAEDAKAILAEHRVNPVKADKYAECIFKLERAQAMLEAAGDTTSVQAQEVNSTLFWAKRFSTLEISNELGKLRVSGMKDVPRPAKPVPSVPLKPVVPVAPATAMLPEAVKLNAAKTGFQEAEVFAGKKRNDPLATALRWFQVASQFSGTEYALKALERAQEAHQRSAASGKSVAAGDAGARAQIEAAELKSDSAEIKLMRDAEKLAESNNHIQAINQYKASIKIKDTISAQSRLGHTYFKVAQKIQEELLPKYKDAEDAYSRAYQNSYVSNGSFKYFNDRNPALVNAKRRIDELRKESDQIIINYVNAQTCFERILKLVPGNKDFEATAYAGISMAKRNEAKFRAKTYLADFLKEYKPANIGEQITYEYCKSELDRIK